MPAIHHPMNVRPLPPGQACPFEWCTLDHVDDWVNDDAGDAYRFHARDLQEAGAESPDGEQPYLVVDEVRTVTGVRFSPARVQLDGHTRLDVDEFGERLARLLAFLPAWRVAALAVDELRADVES